jgi:hypothetical protein
LTDGRDRREAHEPLDPGDHVAHPTLDRGGRSTLFSCCLGYQIWVGGTGSCVAADSDGPPAVSLSAP